MTSDEILQAIGDSILADSAMTPKDWVRVVVSMQQRRGTSSLAAIVFMRDGSYQLRVPQSKQIAGQIDQLGERMVAEENRDRWASMIIQIDNEGEDEVDVNARFDYDDPNRWKITAESLEHVAKELRPRAANDLTKDELIAAVGKSLLGDDKMTPAEWVRVALSRQYQRDASSMSGLVYTSDGKHRSRVPAKSGDIARLLDQLRLRMAEEDASHRLWVSVLIILDNEGADIDIDAKFDYDDPSRWEITFAKLDEVAKELQRRPKSKVKPRKR